MGERVLPVTRYSGDDDTGAVDRHVGQLEAWVAENNAEPVHWVKDETVSGSVNLDERKELGQWLRDPGLSRWTTMVLPTQDRITRDDMHWWQFVGKLTEWGKRLVVLDDPSLDLSTPNGRMIAGVKATMAANYREDVKKKARDAHASFREQRRYAGGHWPYGYRAVRRDDGPGWRFAVDPVTSVLVREAADRVLNDESPRSIVQDWNRRGVDTARDHQARTTPPDPGEQPKQPRGYQWRSVTLRKILLSPHLLGYASYDGEIIREEGLPVQWADPIISVDTSKKLHAKLSERSTGKGSRKNRSPLLGVPYCKCGRVMNFARNKGYEYYRCGSVTSDDAVGCEHARNWPVPFIQQALDDFFRVELADVEIQRREYVPGENYDDEIASVKEAIEHLTGNLAKLPTGSRSADAVIRQLADREAELDRLESQPSTESTWRYIPTGETYGQHWNSLEDWADKGTWLLQAGISVEISGSKNNPVVHFHTPPDVEERLGKRIAQQVGTGKV